jgi:hypothetical protein
VHRNFGRQEGEAMHTQASRYGDIAATPSHELRFTSLYQPGRAVAVPCDESGRVNLDTLSERLLNAYLGARAMVGREYAFPVVQCRH